MSKKDYIATAEVVRAVVVSGGDMGTCLAFAERMSGYFKADNPRFDAGVFYEACGFEVTSIASDDHSQGVGVVEVFPLWKEAS
jgi:hypothetical protein